MKSKISIDVDWDNQPIIRIEHEDSPDVRDKLVKRFMETFGGQSYFATFFFDQSITDMTERANRNAKIRPIQPSKMWEHVDHFKETADKAKISDDN